MLARLTATTLITLAGLTACQQYETAEQTHARMQMESDSARVAIEAREATFVTAINAGDADAIAALYREDGIMLAPDMPTVTGRDNIRAAFETMMAGMPPGTTMAFEVQDVTANGPLAVELGGWVMTIPTPDGGSMAMQGKYVIEWHNIDGTWLIAKDIWNADAPAPPM